MAPSFDNLDNDENFDDVEIDYSGTPPPSATEKDARARLGNL
jgi:hypothetical protein